MEVWDLHDDLYNAARNSKAIYKISSDDKVLDVRGKVIDKVQRTSLVDSTAYNGEGTFMEYFRGAQQSYRIGISLRHYPTGEDVTDALWRTMAWNLHIVRSQNFPSYPSPASHRSSFEKVSPYLASVNTQDEAAVELAVYESGFGKNFIWTSPLCITSNGFLASVPYTTK
jgi:hypothetical protein